MSAFHVRVRAKWVLSGEHAVLRGAQAIALPHPSFSLTLDFSPGGEGLTIFPDEASHILSRVLSRIEGANGIRGRIRLESDIPIGAGLGSSAALCVALTRWVQSWSSDAVPKGEKGPLEFARSLEDSFHGKSSGMDVAVILADEPVAFRMGEGARPIRIKKIPKFTFHDTGVRAMTRDCIEKVQAFRAADPKRGGELDQAMSRASCLALEALQSFDSGQEALALPALPALASAVSQAHECFEAWGLVPSQAIDIIQDLKAKGALACKLTGAGGGGMVVALWAQSP